MENKRLPCVMYAFVNNGLSNMQKALQLTKAACEYTLKYKDDKRLQDFMFYDKHWVILDGGDSNDAHLGEQKGSMEKLYDQISQNGIPYAVAYERELNSTLSAICFLADERVWNSQKYVDFINYVIIESEASIQDEITIRMLEESELISKFSQFYTTWLETMGGKENLFLRKFIEDKDVLFF